MKFKRLDEKYLNERRRFSARYGPRELWSVIDHWPLYCGLGNLARAMAVSDVLRASLRVPGHVAEFGTWRGANTLFLAKLLKIYDPHGGKVVHAFDSFAGLAEFSRPDGVATRHRRRYRGSLEELRDVIELYHLADDVEIHAGRIETTLPRLLKQRPELSFSLVYCDTDLYRSTRLILEKIHPRLAKGGIFLMDEWNDETFPGEGTAVNEFLRKFGKFYALEHLPNTRKPTLLMRKK